MFTKLKSFLIDHWFYNPVHLEGQKKSQNDTLN